MKTRFFVALFAIMALFVGQDAFGKTKLPTVKMQAALAGSIKGAASVTLVKPGTSPLLKWARAASEKARQERLARNGGIQTVVQTADDSEFSRDRD